MMALLKLIRWSNLLIIFATQWLVWVCVIRRFTGSGHVLDFPHFLLLSLSTVFIAAAGYIINDYFDVRIDNINRPEKMVLEKAIPRKTAIILHSLLNATGLVLAAIVARQGGHYHWLLVQGICTLLLWFYSTRFKRQFMAGNIIVSLLTAFTIVVLVIYEPALHRYMDLDPYTETTGGVSHVNPFYLLAIYTFFAFILTWMREIVKDMEDLKGDEAEGCVTMPIVWGLKRASVFTQWLAIPAIATLLFSALHLVTTRNWILGLYTSVALVLPLCAWTFNLRKAATTVHYARASRQLKIIMVLGLGSLIINYFSEWLN
ncbi:MAG: prenyltransferase [Sphingobacteriales bacterium]|nr:MAG: prenyltransferase [Sphingobacteriales bacterium]